MTDRSAGHGAAASANRPAVGAGSLNGRARFARNSGFGAVAGVATALAGFLSSVIVARFLDVAQTGAVAFAVWIVMFAATVADLGMAATMSRFIPELAARGRFLDADNVAPALLRISVASSIAVLFGFGLYAGCTWLDTAAPREDAILWLLIGIACASKTVAGLALAYLRGIQRFDRAARLTIASVGVQLVGVAAGSLYFGVNGAVAGYCGGALVPAVFAATLFRRRKVLAAGLARRMWRFSFYACAGGLLSGFVWSRMELVFLQQFWGSEAVGLFAVSLSLANLAGQGPMLLTGGLLPYFAERFGTNNMAAVRSAYASGTRVLAFLVLPMCFGMAAVMPAALPVIFGSAFSAAIPAATILVMGAAFGAIGSAGVNLLYGMDRSDFLFANGAVGALLSLAAGLTIVPQFGLLGAAWTRLGIQTVLVLIGFWFITRRLSCPAPFGALARLALAALACAAAARLCLVAIPGSAGLPLAIAAGALVYFTTVRLLQALPRGDIEHLLGFNLKLPPPLRTPGALLLGWMAGVSAVPSTVPGGTVEAAKRGER